MAIRNLKFVLSGSDKGASKTFDAVGKKADGLSSKFAGIGGAAKAGIAGLAGGALVTGGKAVFDMAAQMEALDAKAKTVFGGSLGTVDKWAKGNAGAMGLTSKEATGLAAGFADLLIPMGFTRDQAAKMSTETVGLSGALSQWSGGTVSAAEASDILAKAMLGETDGLKSLGISISAADVEARLLANGQNKLEGAARDQAEAQAVQALIMEKSTDAQAAFKKSGGTLLGQQQKLTAGIKEFRDKGIAALIPMLLKAADYTRKELVPAFRDTVTWARDNLLPVFRALFDHINDRVIPVIRDLAGRVMDGLKSGMGKIKEAIDENRPQIDLLLEAFGKVADFVKDVLIDVLGPVLEAGFKAAGATIGTLLDIIGEVVDASKAMVIGILDGIREAIGGFRTLARAGSILPGKAGIQFQAADIALGAYDKKVIEAQNRVARAGMPAIPQLNDADVKNARRTAAAPSPTRTYRDQRTAGLSVNIDGNKATTAVSEKQQGRLARGFVAAY